MDKTKKYYHKPLLDGVLPSPKDNRDYKFKDIDLETTSRKVAKAVSASSLPKTYKSLVVKNKFVFDQDEVGMCVACTIAMMWHVMTRLLNHVSIKFSPARVYSDRELKSGETGVGMYPREALDNVIKHGICSFTNFKTIAEYPKVRNQYLKFKAKIDNIAKYFRADSYYSCDEYVGDKKDTKATLINIKKAVKATGCCLVVVPCYEMCGPSWHYYDDETKKTPLAYISDWEENEAARGKFEGYHAMLCIGWDDTKKALWLVNSYGEDWGTNGKAYLHYDYPIYESWAVVTHKHKITPALIKLLNTKIVK